MLNVKYYLQENKYFFNLVIVQLWMNVKQQRPLKI